MREELSIFTPIFPRGTVVSSYSRKRAQDFYSADDANAARLARSDRTRFPLSAEGADYRGTMLELKDFALSFAFISAVNMGEASKRAGPHK